MKRRSFLAAMLAASTSPAIVKAGILMPGRGIIVPGPARASFWIESWWTSAGILRTTRLMRQSW